MIFLKIITQVITGLSGLIALLLDYKWHDKRKKIFKKLRNALIVFALISLIAGICITIVDENEKKKDEVRMIKELEASKANLLYVKNNSDTLKSQLKPFLELATKQYPHLPSNEALEKLQLQLDRLDIRVETGTNKINSLTSQLSSEIKTIRSFEAKINIEFSGNWNEPPYPVWYQPPSPRAFIKWSSENKTVPEIEFSTSKVLFKTLNKSTGVFENTLSVLPGQYPLGQVDDILKKYNQVSFGFLLSEPDRVIDSKVYIKKVQIQFFINNKENGSFFSEQTIDMDVPKSSSPYYTPMMLLEGNIIQLLKIQIE